MSNVNLEAAEAPLSGLTVVEGSAFVAAPLAGMTLAQLGADVIRFDDLNGGLDYARWPLGPTGRSLFWAGLNKGKRSIRVNLRDPRGREIATELIASAGNFITNFPARGWLEYDRLKAVREDLVMVALKGNRDGTSEVDYTVNPATGFPWATGPRNSNEPLNSVLPAWDAIMGGLAATGLLAAAKHRSEHGPGQLVEISLSDTAFAMVGHLGRIAEAQIGGVDHAKDGNYLYGAFGHDFETKDGRRVMVVALTKRQWHALLEATGMRESMNSIAELARVDLDTETGRFQARDLIAACFRPWFGDRDLTEISEAFSDSSVSWGPYQTFRQLVEEDPRCSEENPMWSKIEHPGVGTYLTPGTPLDFSEIPRQPPVRAPSLGEHTIPVLIEHLSLSDAEIGRLLEAGIIGLPD